MPARPASALVSMPGTTTMEIKSRTIIVNCDVGSLPFETVADFSVRESLVYRRMWAASWCAYPASLGGTHARARWRTRIFLTDESGNEIQFASWRMDYESPGTINPSTDNSDDMSFAPPYTASVRIGDPDKAMNLSMSGDTRVLHRRISNTESVMAVCCPMSITGRFNRVRMRVDEFTDSAPGQTLLFAGIMMQSQALPYT